MSYTGRYPAARPRRLRQSEWIRRLTREHRLSADDLIWSLVVHAGDQAEIPVAAMPGAPRLSVSAAAEAARRAAKLGIPAIAVFPYIDAAKKHAVGKEALNPHGLVCTAVRAMKDAAPEVGVMVDVALDPFTDHGHDGLLREGRIVNDETVKVLTEQALVQVRAGADIVAPSDMMDGRVGAIRAALDAEGHRDTLIMSYAAKYASAFYGPYREAIGSGKLGSGSVANPGDKRTYQMDFGNTDEAMREVAMDVAEGADMLLIKPGLPYLDIVARVKREFGLPTYAFQVSGEYAMIKAAKAREVGTRMRQSIQNARRAGVRVAFGTDSGVSRHGGNAREFQFLVEGGYTPSEAIRIATVDAADHLRLTGTAGRIAPGYSADIIAVDGDPTQDVTTLMNVRFVMARGTAHRNE